MRLASSERNMDPASFRDPAGCVLSLEGRVFRAIGPSVWSDFDAIRTSGILRDLIDAGRVIETAEIDRSDLPSGLGEIGLGNTRRFLEHERIAFISYPYEWPFRFLRRAALHHLDLHLDLLRAGFTLIDASAYNLQFRGTSPVFIDVLSIRKYQEGEYWPGYRQFCEQFLNPLLMGSELGLPYQHWFRGSLNGIRIEDMAHAMPLRSRLCWKAWLHVFLHAKFTSDLNLVSIEGSTAIRPRNMPKPTLVWLLSSMRSWISGMTERGQETSRWLQYEHVNSYLDCSVEGKKAFIAAYASRVKPVCVLDLGCNSGTYAEVVLSSGATRVIGFDQDLGALDVAIDRADGKCLDFLPLFMDATNPSPDQGWAQSERAGLKRRVNADGLLALALLHHIVIGQNVPIARTVAWLVGLAPSGVIEFVPKSDPMVVSMMKGRKDIFTDYSIETFRDAVTSHAWIVAETAVVGSGRVLFEYARLESPK
jgi:ribosomal protein L11 methylase PrmA